MYNAYTNFFSTVTLLTELLPTGGYYQYDQINTIRLYRYTGPEQMVVMAFEIVYFVFLFVFFYHELKEFFQLKKAYFKDPWNYIEMFIIGLSFSAVGLYLARMIFTNIAIKQMQEDPKRFINFNYVELLDECFTALMSFTVFCAFLKFLRLLRFNRRMSLLTRTVQSCAKPLLSFMVIFLLAFFAYMQCAMLIFGPSSASYATVPNAMASLLSMTLGGFDFNSLANANRFLGPLFFFSYMMSIFLILTNVFLSIINDAFAEVSSDVDKQSNEHEIVYFMVHRLKEQIGQQVGPAVKPVYKEVKSKFDQDLETITDTAENLEYALMNVCLEDLRQANWLNVEGCTEKKKSLIKTLLCPQYGFTEDDLADAIPLMDTFIAKHTEEQLEQLLTRSTIPPEHDSRSPSISEDEDDSDNGSDSDNALTLTFDEAHQPEETDANRPPTANDHKSIPVSNHPSENLTPSQQGDHDNGGDKQVVNTGLGQSGNQNDLLSPGEFPDGPSRDPEGALSNPLRASPDFPLDMEAEDESFMGRNLDSRLSTWLEDENGKQEVLKDYSLQPNSQ